MQILREEFNCLVATVRYEGRENYLLDERGQVGHVANG